jgi:hypothetical protein
MKNIITVFAFAVTLLLGVQTTSAQSLSQDKNRPEVIAKAETAKLTESLGLNGDQGRTVFRALVAKEVGYQKNVAGKDAKDATVASEKKKLDDQLKEAMKKTLTADQYNTWLKTNN